MSDRAWDAVDAYVVDRLIGLDRALDRALAANVDAGLPPIDVSAPQGKLLSLVARMSGARRVLEIGTLGGYSTIWLARAVGVEGQVVSLEIDPHHAAVARTNVDAAGVGDRVDIRVGRAVDTLATMTGEPPFDFVFIDADKPSNPLYLRAALSLSRPGTVIICDNVVRDGRVVDSNSADPSVVGTRALFDMIADESRLDATAIQTVGAKGWDGFAIMIVGE